MNLRWNTLPFRLRLYLSLGTVLVLAMLAALYWQARSHSSERLDTLVEDALPAQVESLAAHLSLSLSPALALSDSLANNTYLEQWVAEGMPLAERRAMTAYLQRLMAQLDTELLFIAARVEGQSIYLQYRDGALQQRTMGPRGGDDDWYYRFTESNRDYELNLDADSFSQDESFVFLNFRSDTLSADGLPLVVAGAGLDLSQMADMIEEFNLTGVGRAALLNADGEWMVGSDEAGNSTTGTSVPLALSPQTGLQVQEVEYDGQTYLVATRWLPEIDRYLMIELNKDDYLNTIGDSLLASAGAVLLILLISLIVLYPLTGSLIRPLTQLQRQLKDITQSLDLSRRVETDDQAEVGDLALQTNALLERLSRAIAAVSHNAAALATAADQLARTAGLSGIQQGRDVQQEASQTMAAAVEEMASSVAEITSTMEELSTSSTQIADHSQSVVDVANQTLERSRKGSNAMQRLQTKMHDIRSDSEQSLAEIVTLGAKSKQISKVMELINNLAAQTKLIAFNAALEASSAGEAGRRFSVVAGEIRRLADSVTDSTQEIEGHTDEIQNAINRLVVASEKSAASIEEGVEASSSTGQDLEALVKAASQTSSAAQQISLSTQQQKTASNQVVLALRDIDTVSTRNAQSVRNITDISEEMIKMSAELSELVQEFTVAPAKPLNKPLEKPLSKPSSAETKRDAPRR
ncbi:methyl-accepting chemotaxis protein [Halomonas dongshanensis]|uniref:Methyl-accepting chemotaxis protein n=1 Tax=Halomonas dongshanensis TaxID=2890835 RepID=A0ABT2EHZ2_9GAMM|nr:methyl-accepting chemotaxis protein [Halomonas dongshanensis]MCS2611200.1 methyl-accepting chemotaxis protein [Halomonas dongshanensis]